MRYYWMFALAAGLWLFSSCESGTGPRQPDAPGALWSEYTGRADADSLVKVVLVSGDEEYRSEEALTQLAQILAKRHGFDCTVLFAQDPAAPGYANPNYAGHIPGLAHLSDAGLLVLFTRFRALPDSQMRHIAQYLSSGKPVIGLRTATHAFRFSDTSSLWRHWGNYYEGEDTAWHGGFGQLVLGANWHSHHGHHKHQSTRGIIPTEARSHPVLNGIESGEIWGPTDVYGLSKPLSAEAKALVYGQVTENTGVFDEADLMYGMRESHWAISSTNPGSTAHYNPNDPMMPVVWVQPYQLPGGEEGEALTCTMGASTDMLDEELRRLLVNAAYYLTGQPVPDKANVDTVGAYTPTAFGFHDDGYWQARQWHIPKGY